MSSDQSATSRPLDEESQSVAKMRAAYQGDHTHDQYVKSSPRRMGDPEVEETGTRYS